MRGQQRDYEHWAAHRRRRQLALGRGAGRTSSATRTTTRALSPCTAPVASGASSGNGCAGTCSTPGHWPRSRPACRPPTTSTAATTKGSATSKSTRKPAGAGTPRRPSCVRRACAGRTSRCGPARRCRSWRIETRRRRRAALHRRRRGAQDGERVVGHGPRAKSCSAPARSARCRSCSCPASARPTCCGRTASTPLHDAARRRREPAGPPADPRGVQGAGCEDAELDRRQLVGQGRHRCALRADTQRADEHVTVATRRVHAQCAAARAPEHRIPRAAAQPGRVRRAAAPLRRLHRQRVQPEPDAAAARCASAARISRTRR